MNPINEVSTFLASTPTNKDDWHKELWKSIRCPKWIEYTIGSSKSQPFDLDKALAGEPIETMSGYAARILATDLKSKYPIAVVVTTQGQASDYVMQFDKKGHPKGTHSSLIMSSTQTVVKLNSEMVYALKVLGYRYIAMDKNKEIWAYSVKPTNTSSDASWNSRDCKYVRLTTPEKHPDILKLNWENSLIEL